MVTKTQYFPLQLQHRGSIFRVGVGSRSAQGFCAKDRVVGIDGAKVWDMRTYKEVRTPEQAREHRGQVVCMSWVTLPNDKNETLCFATGLGYLVFWEQHTEVRILYLVKKHLTHRQEKIR
jgi:hypothetical protein